MGVYKVSMCVFVEICSSVGMCEVSERLCGCVQSKCMCVGVCLWRYAVMWACTK